MKNFELIESTTYDEILDEEITTQILKVTEGEKVTWVSTESGSSRYAEYLRYTAWVEAGNNPEDFWTQDEALLTEGEEE